MSSTPTPLAPAPSQHSIQKMPTRFKGIASNHASLFSLIQSTSQHTYSNLIYWPTIAVAGDAVFPRRGLQNPSIILFIP